MAKKKTSQVSLESQSTVGEEVSLETNPIETIYTQERKEILIKLQSVVAPTNAQIQQIYELYKIFINPYKSMPNTSGSCSSCGNSISKLYWELMAWWRDNKNKFN
jgi:hypothetical protein